MIEVRNLDKVIQQIDSWERAVYNLVSEVGRGLSVELFNLVVEVSPQYSGDFAANWKYELNKVSPTFESGLFQILGANNEVKHHQGDREAIGFAHRANMGNDAAMKLGDTAYIHNSAVHDEAYAPLIWDGAIRLREVNTMAGTVEQRYSNWASHLKVIDGPRAQQLIRRRI